jgi:hypothetical protein
MNYRWEYKLANLYRGEGKGGGKKEGRKEGRERRREGMWASDVNNHLVPRVLIHEPKSTQNPDNTTRLDALS